MGASSSIAEAGGGGDTMPVSRRLLEHLTDMYCSASTISSVNATTNIDSIRQDCLCTLLQLLTNSEIERPRTALPSSSPLMSPPSSSSSDQHAQSADRLESTYMYLSSDVYMPSTTRTPSTSTSRVVGGHGAALWLSPAVRYSPDAAGGAGRSSCHGSSSIPTTTSSSSNPMATSASASNATRRDIGTGGVFGRRVAGLLVLGFGLVGLARASTLGDGLWNGLICHT